MKKLLIVDVPDGYVLEHFIDAYTPPMKKQEFSDTTLNIKEVHLPTDKEIDEEYLRRFPYEDAPITFADGADWIKDQILKQ